MELREYIAIARRWWWLLVLGAVIAGGAGYIVSSLIPPVYQSTTTLIVGRLAQSANPSLTEINTVQRLAQSYAQLVTREPVLQATINALQLDMAWTDLREMVTARPVIDTQLIEISVKAGSPEQAQIIANALAQQLILSSPSTVDPEQAKYRDFVKNQLSELQENIVTGQARLQELQAALELETTPEGMEQRSGEIDALQSKLDIWQNNYAVLLSFMQTSEEGVNYLTIIDPAIMPKESLAKVTQNTLLAAIVGLLIAMGIVFLLEYLDNTLKTTADVQQALNLTALGTIPQITPASKKNGHNGQVIKTPESFSPTAEAYRTLRTNIQFSTLILANAANTLLVTSAGIGEGKSTTAANLAAVMAQSGKRVILVDTDLRRPVLHKYFNIANERGLTTLLTNEQLVVEDLLVGTTINNLRVLPSGPLPPNAADFLSSDQMSRLIDRLTGLADTVIFDSPPLLAVTDARILATRMGATLIVADTGRTRIEACHRCLEILAQVGVKPLGVVLNKFNPKQEAGYYGYSNYYYSDKSNGRHSKVEHGQ